MKVICGPIVVERILGYQQRTTSLRNLIHRQSGHNAGAGCDVDPWAVLGALSFSAPGYDTFTDQPFDLDILKKHAMFVDPLYLYRSMTNPLTDDFYRIGSVAALTGIAVERLRAGKAARF